MVGQVERPHGVSGRREQRPAGEQVVRLPGPELHGQRKVAGVQGAVPLQLEAAVVQPDVPVAVLDVEAGRLSHLGEDGADGIPEHALMRVVGVLPVGIGGRRRHRGTVLAGHRVVHVDAEVGGEHHLAPTVVVDVEGAQRQVASLAQRVLERSEPPPVAVDQVLAVDLGAVIVVGQQLRQPVAVQVLKHHAAAAQRIVQGALGQQLHVRSFRQRQLGLPDPVARDLHRSVGRFAAAHQGGSAVRVAAVDDADGRSVQQARLQLAAGDPDQHPVLRKRSRQRHLRQHLVPVARAQHQPHSMAVLHGQRVVVTGVLVAERNAGRPVMAAAGARSQLVVRPAPVAEGQGRDRRNLDRHERVEGAGLVQHPLLAALPLARATADLAHPAALDDPVGSVPVGQQRLLAHGSSREGVVREAHGQFLGAHPVEAKLEVEALGVQSCEVHASVSPAVVRLCVSASLMGFHTRTKPNPWKSRTFAVASSVTP